jgi:hypothetical protein
MLALYLRGPTHFIALSWDFFTFFSMYAVSASSGLTLARGSLELCLLLNWNEVRGSVVTKALCQKT